MTTASVQRDISRHDRTTAFLIFGFLLACYLLTYTARIDSSDGLSMFSTTENLVRRGGWDSNQILWMGSQQGNIGVGGDLFTRKGIGMLLLAAPLVWLARHWPAIGLVHTALLLNPLVTAWTGALLFRAGRRLGWSRSTSAATALLFGLATMAWPYTQGFFSDPICAWGLFAGAYGLLAYAQSGRKLYLFGAGLAWSIAYLTRTINLITLPIYVLGLYYVLDTVVRRRTHEPKWQLRLNDVLHRQWRPLVSFFLPVVLAGVISIWWNWVRFGSLWDTGYVETEAFNGDWLFGFLGLTVGPARGFFWYNPILLLAIPGAICFWRRHRKLLLLAMAIVAIYFVVYAKWYMWHGGYSWGPRFLAPTVPFLSLVAGAGWVWLWQPRRLAWLARAAGLLLLGVSIGVQWLGMLVPYGLVQDWLAAKVQPLFAPETFTRLEYSPLVLQWQFLKLENIQFAWWRGAPWPNTVDWLALSMPLAAIAVGILIIVQQARSPEADRDDAARYWLYAGALAVIALAMLTYFQVALRSDEINAVAQHIQSAEHPGDAILYLAPGDTATFSNAYAGRLPVYGFFNRGDLAGDEAGWLKRLASTYKRLWVVPDYLAPEQSGWERPLRTDNFLLTDDRVSGPNKRRVVLYATAPGSNVSEVGLGTVFGDPAGPQPITEKNGWIRLNGYSLTAQTQPGGAILLTLQWESLQPVNYNYQVFVHLLDQFGNKVAQRDGQPVQWMRPTSTWKLNEEIVDRYGLLLPDTLPTGVYTIAVGLYDPVSGQRLPVSAGPASFAIELGPIEVR